MLEGWLKWLMLGVVFKVADRKRFSNLVRVIGESEADWVDEALERHGIVIPGGVS